MVILSHWLPDHWINNFQIGRLGVDLFFVISGFLITRILFQLKENTLPISQKLKTFFIRRALRIFPLYYFVVLITYIFNGGIFEEALLWNLFYGSNFFILELDSWPGIMSHFWTLSVEEHFYLFWPFVILIPNKNRTLYAISMVILIGLLSRFLFFYFEFPYLYSYIFTSSCFDAFGIGGVLGFLYFYKNGFLYDKILQHKLLLALCCLGFTISIASTNIPGQYFHAWNSILFRFFYAILFFFLVGFSINSKSILLNNKYLVFLGKLSYSMYLFHNFIPGFLMGIQYPVNIYLRFFLYFPCLILVSYFSWKLIELPFNRLKLKFKYVP